MSQFTKMKMAPAGREVLALCHQGAALALSQIIVGNGEWTQEQQSGSPPSALVSPKRAVTITSITPQGDIAVVRGMLTNVGLEEGFSITEIGITATHPQTGVDVLYMADYCPPDKSSYFPAAQSGVVTVEIPISVQILIASGGEVEMVVRDRFYSATLQDIDDHDADTAAHPGLRVQTPTLAFTGADHIDEGGSTTLAVVGYVAGTWPTEAKVKITDAGGADVSALFTTSWNAATGVLSLTAPMVAATASYGVQVQLWEHGLIRATDWSASATLVVGDVPINRPTITAPADGATNIGATPTLTTSAFSADGAQTHAASRFQISLLPDFSTLVHDSGQDATHLTSYMVPAATLSAGQHYYTRAQHKGSDGNWSPWSPTVAFFTSASFVYVTQPNITSPASGATGIGETPTIAASAFGTNGAGSHASTDWQIDLATGSFASPVHQSLADAAHKTSYPVPSGVLQPNTAYKARVRYRDTTGTPVVSDWSSPVSFTTAVNFLTAWAAWNETSEASLAHPDTFVWLAENPTSGGNEVGQGGGLSGTDAIITQLGNVPGATGSPPSRSCSRQGFTHADAVYSAFLNRTTMTHIIKLQDVPRANGYVWNRYGAFAVMALCNDGQISIGGQRTSEGWPTSGIFYLALWSDGTTVRAGWSTTKPTKLSDFVSGRVVAATAVTPAQVAACIFYAPNYHLLGNNSVGGKVYYEVFSKECLINNAA